MKTSKNIINNNISNYFLEIEADVGYSPYQCLCYESDKSSTSVRGNAKMSRSTKTFPIPGPSGSVRQDAGASLAPLFAHSPPLNHIYQPLDEAKDSYSDQR